MNYTTWRSLPEEFVHSRWLTLPGANSLRELIHQKEGQICLNLHKLSKYKIWLLGRAPLSKCLLALEKVPIVFWILKKEFIMFKVRNMQHELLTLLIKKNDTQKYLLLVATKVCKLFKESKPYSCRCFQMRFYTLRRGLIVSFYFKS